MAIQNRRGSYSAFDKSKLVPGEMAFVISGDPTTPSGTGAYACFGDGDVQRLTTYEENEEFRNDVNDTIEGAKDALASGMLCVLGGRNKIAYIGSYSITVNRQQERDVTIYFPSNMFESSPTQRFITLEPLSLSVTPNVVFIVTTVSTEKAIVRVKNTDTNYSFNGSLNYMFIGNKA